MDFDAASYSHEEFSLSLGRLISEVTASKAVTPKDTPTAILLGGQSGAGKSTLHKIFLEQFSHDIIPINGDEYRSAHPRYRELDRLHGIDSVKYTAPWAGAMTEALIEALSKARYNLIVEGTLRTAEVPTKTATLLTSRGYSVSLALMAVKPEISLISCQMRYEEMRIAGTIPRATDPAHHAKIVEAIVSNIEQLEQSDLFDSIELYNRSERRLYSSKSDSGKASDAMRSILFGEWTDEERTHYQCLKRRLEELQRRAPSAPA